MSIIQENVWLVAIFFTFITFVVVALILKRRSAQLKPLGCAKRVGLMTRAPQSPDKRDTKPE